MKKNTFETVTLSTSEKEKLRRIAEKEHRSMAQQVSWWIEQYEQKESA